MAEVHRLREHRRELISDGDRSALRATWHRDSGFVVISLWRDDTCVATSHLTPGEAGRLASFITGGLAEIATEAHRGGSGVARVAASRSLAKRLNDNLRMWRRSVAVSLESTARRLRQP
ncbi:MAG TPA: hypothetical protein VLA91_06555 [Acidimicrobiia bacterium]|nr:hypothetical protein [Acidimicrobiia bacterium]